MAPRLTYDLAMKLERRLGWWLACTVHPQAAWRALRPSGRALLVGTYFAAAYVAALTLLLGLTFP